MNVTPQGPQAINPAVWEHPEMRRALAARDIGTLYALLQRIGISQRRIAALTGQSQSEISEIRSGRQVMAYDVLVRIAQGLGIPLGYLGLAYDASTTEIVLAASSSRRPAPIDEGEEVRRLLAHAAEVTIGAAVAQVDRWWQPVDRSRTPVPERIGAFDIHHLQSITHSLRAIDYQYGGGACRDAVLAQVEWAQQLLLCDFTEDIGRRLHLALADLHNLAGWTSFDIGLYSAARRHFARALEQAKYSNDSSLVANVLYRTGRLHLHRGLITEALKFFQLGQIAAQDTGCELTVAMLCANEAWAYALLGDETQALKSQGRAEDEFARARPHNAATWVRFFSTADLSANGGVVRVSLPNPTPKRLDSAAAGLIHSLDERGPDMARSRAFELTALATVHLLSGDLDLAVPTGHQAVDMVEHIRSVRIIDRLGPLHHHARKRTRTPEVKELAQRIATLRAA